MVDDNRRLMQFLNGLVRLFYYDEEGITLDYLKSELFPRISAEDFDQMVTKYRGMLKRLVSSNMDARQAEAFLTAQSRKKDSGLSEAEATALRTLWGRHHGRIRQRLEQKVVWSRRLNNLSWRLDVHEGTPSAIVEMQLSKSASQNAPQDATDVVQFEMNAKSMQKMIEELREIETQITKHSNQEF